MTNRTELYRVLRMVWPVLGLLASGSAVAQTGPNVWNGAIDNFATNPGNYVGGVIAGDDYVYAGAAPTGIDVPGIFNASRLNITAGTYTFSGAGLLNTFGFGNGIYTSGTGSVVVTNRLVFDASYVVDAAGGDVSLGGVIDATPGFTFTKTGAGTLTLSGANVFPGTVVLNGGTTVVGAANNLGASARMSFDGGTLRASAPFNLAKNVLLDPTGGTLDTAGNAVTWSGAVSGSGGLTKVGAGTLTLSGANDYAGATNINGGTLSIASADNLGTGALTFDGGTLQFTAPITFATNAILNAGGGTIDPGANALTMSGILSGAGGLTKAGAGTLTLTAANTYSGGTNLNAGILSVAAVNSLGTGALVFGGGTLQTTAAMTLAANATLNAGGGSLDTAGNAVALSGVISGVGGLTKAGAGLLTLSGANTYSGGTTVAAGTLAGDSTSLQGAIVNNANVTFNQAANGAYAGVMSGTGSLTKNGAGLLTLSGANTYSGGTTVAAGTLAGDSTSLQGAIVNNANVTFNQAANGAYAGVMSGTGSLTKNGAGLLMLSGANTYSGGTTVAAGTLAGDSTSLQGAIVNNANVTFNQAANGAYAGVMSGTGSLTKNGAGLLTLSGANTYSGGTNLNAGILSVAAVNSLGTGALAFGGGTLQTTAAMTLAANATLNAGGGSLDTAGNAVALSGVISGAGGLTKAGAGTLALSGANTYSGGTTVAAGTLAGDSTSLQGAIVNNANVTFNQAANGTYAGVMSGTGSLTKNGAGLLTLSGASTFTGASDLNAGTLAVNGTNGSTVNIASAATLQGTGTVGGIVVNSGGILAPGNSIGTINVSGNVAFNPGSMYNVEVNPAGQSDRTLVTGVATINGGTVNVQAAAGVYNASTTYTILTANGGRSGVFSGVTSNFAFLTPSLGYDASNVFLTLTSNASFASAAQTRSGIAVATNLDANGAAATGDFATITGTITGLTAPQARAAFDALSGVIHAAIPGVARTGVGSFGRLLARRAASAQGEREGTGLAFSGLTLASNELAPVRSDAPLLAQAGSAQGAGSRQEGPGRGFWFRGQGLDHRYNGDGNAPGQNVRSSGAAFGFDGKLSGKLVLGIAGSYDRASVGTAGNGDNARVRDTRIGVYGNWRDGPWTLSGQASYSAGSVATYRSVAFGVISRTADASYRMRQWYAQAEAAYRIRVGGATVSPLAGFEVSSIRRGAFTETGAGAANLVVDGKTTESFASNLGVRYERALDSQDPAAGAFELRAIWSHEFGEVGRTFAARMSGAPTAATFTTAGVTQQRDALIAGAGVSGRVSKDFSLYGEYNLELRGSQKTHAVVAGLRYSF